MRGRGERALAAALVLGLVAAWLAARWPTRGLWYDETVNAYFAQQPWRALWEWCTRIDNQLPLDFALRKAWGLAAGMGEFALRAYSAGLMLLAAAGVLALGRRVSGRALGGWLAALAFALTHSFLYAAYEVRPYALALALYAWSGVVLWSLWERYGARPRPLDRGYRARLAAYLALALALLYTHYTAFLALAAHAVYLLLRFGPRLTRRQATILAQIGLGLALGYLPWLLALAGRDVRAGTAFEARVAPPQALQSYAEFYVYGQHAPPPGGPHYELIVPAAVALGLVALIFAGLRGRRAWRGALWVAAGTAIPLLLLVIMVFAVQGKLSGRHGWPVWIGAALALGAGAVAAGRTRLLRGALSVGVLALLWLPARLDLQPTYNSYLREAFAYVREHRAPGDVLVLRDGTLFTAAGYYDAPLPWIGLPPDKLLDVHRFLFADEAVAALDALVAAHDARRVWVLAWQGEIMDPQNVVAGVLEAIGTPQPLLGATGFGDVHLSLYTLHQSPRAVGDMLAALTPLAQVPPDGPMLLGEQVIGGTHVARGGALLLHTWWQRGATIMPGVRLSVRLYDADGVFYAQVDQPPAAFAFGQEHWPPGVPVLTRTLLPVPAEMPRGPAWVRVVLYDVEETFAPITVTLAEVRISQ